MDNNKIDMPTKYFESLHYVIQGLMRLDPDKNSPAGQLLNKLAKAISEYEDNFFKIGDSNEG